MSDSEAFEESVVVFSCSGETLLGVVASPVRPARTGVVIVVGGPQYRIGSHRQFVHLSRFLAARGIGCMRFDYRGIGDSTGAIRNFEQISDDVRAAIDVFVTAVPTLGKVVLWGLCDGAAAAVFYAHSDERVAALILANPWVRTEAGQAKSYLRHYYLRRILDIELWKKVLNGRLNFGKSLGDFAANVRSARSAATLGLAPSGIDQASLPDRVADGLARFRGRVYLLISGDDHTATEFCDRARDHARLRSALETCNARWTEFAGVDHTFSSADAKLEIAQVTLQSLEREGLCARNNV